MVSDKATNQGLGDTPIGIKVTFHCSLITTAVGRCCRCTPVCPGQHDKEDSDEALLLSFLLAAIEASQRFFIRSYLFNTLKHNHNLETRMAKIIGIAIELGDTERVVYEHLSSLARVYFKF